MKIQGTWRGGQAVDGKWIYPNGIYYEGGFENNKPIGQGQWHFKNGNVLSGEYEQRKKEGEEEEEEVEEAEEGAEVVPKPKFDLVWVPHTNIAKSAQ